MSFHGRSFVYRALWTIALVAAGAGAALAECDPTTQDCRPLWACTGGYALCTSAPCIPVPATDGDDRPVAPTTSLCDCDIVYGANIAQTDCDTRDTGDGNFISAYSFAQTAALQQMTCPASPAFATDFTNCLNAPCKADPDDPTRADCTCPIVQASAPWVTFGGGCDRDTCTTTLWSGATLAAVGAATCCLVEYMRIGTQPDGMVCDDVPSCTIPYENCS